MIALSYRREDSVVIAGRLYDRLQSAFGKQNVFMDFDSIPAGVDFREHILRAIERSHVLVAVIGPNWLGEKDGGRRIDNPNDFVRFEVGSALARGIPVIPVLANDAQMPDLDELPPDLKELAYRNALPLDGGLDFHGHAERLVAALRVIPGVARQNGRLWQRPAWLIAGIVTAMITIGLIIVVIARLFYASTSPTTAQEHSPTQAPGIVSTTRTTPADSPTVLKRENSSESSPPTVEPSAVPLREFTGRWANKNTSPLGGNGTLTVADQLIVQDKDIQETIATEWVSEGKSVFRITLRVRFGELWTFNNQLNARCLAADVIDMKDPKDFGKYANMREQTMNAAKAGVGLVYTWTLNGTELRRGGMTWVRQK